MSKIVKKYSKLAITLGLILAIVAMYFGTPIVRAATISDRELKISDSREGDQGGTGVIYDFQGDHSGTTVMCLRLQICTTITGGCTVPDGLDTTGGAKDSTNWSGWIAANFNGNFTTNGTIDYLHTDAGQSGGNDYSFSTSGITNPDSSATYYARVTTYSDSCGGTEVDSGVVAFAILQGGITVSAAVRETLSVTISDYAIGFGDLDVSNVRYATADELGDISEPGNDLPTYIQVSTNAGLGMVITIKDIGDGAGGAGLYSSDAAKLIAAVGATPSVPGAGTEGYAVYGKDAGTGITIDEGFDNDASGALAIDDVMQIFASSSAALDAKNVDISAKAAISGTTPAGTYSDTLILVVTPNY